MFDLDGTLVHTTPEYRYMVVGQSLHELGTASSNHNIDRFWFGSRRDDIIKKNFGLDSNIFWETFRKFDTIEQRRQFTKLYDDIGFIQELKQKGYKIGIVTGAPINIASLEIGMIGEQNFDAVVIANSLSGIKEKPHPHGLEECLNLLEIQNKEAIYVGNGEEDIRAARSAHIYDVLLDRREHLFPKINPSLTIHSLYELRQLLDIKIDF